MDWSVIALGGVAGLVVYLVLWDRQRRAEYREDRDRARAAIAARRK